MYLPRRIPAAPQEEEEQEEEEQDSHEEASYPYCSSRLHSNYVSISVRGGGEVCVGVLGGGNELNAPGTTAQVFQRCGCVTLSLKTAG